MRSVIDFAPAVRAQVRSAPAPGTPRRGTAYCTATLFFCSVAVVRIDDARDEGMAHDVLRAELGEGDAAHTVENAPRLDEAALLSAREVDLRDVAVYHGLGAEADAREEHLHLLGGRVLRLVEDDERMVQRPATHVGERRQLDRAALEELAGLLEAHQVVERVVERRLARRPVVEMLDGLCRAIGLLAAHRELSPAPGDRHVERRLDLPEVLVERAAQARKALVVDGIEAHLDRLRPHRASSPL